jgi:inner membrane protein
MDSVSQFALGAVVGVAVMRRRMTVGQAALWGGLCGTLPDLDSFIGHGDALRDMVLHRAQTHALIWQTIATPLIAAVFMTLSGWFNRRRLAYRPASEKAGYARWCLMVWLALTTHALLDGFTVYGTQLLLPLSREAYGLGSIFIIDPLYTLPLLIGLTIALLTKGPRGLRANAWGLALSCLYLGWSSIAQVYVSHHVKAELRAQGSPAEDKHLLVTPTAFNTLLWRIVVMRGDRYEEGFYSLLDGGRPIRFSQHPIDTALRDEAQSIESVRTLYAFSDGFVRTDERQGLIRVTDLRMGQEPAYVFSFVVAQRGSALTPVVPRAVGGRGDVPIGQALNWLWRRAAGADIDPLR